MADKEIASFKVTYRQILNEQGELVGELPGDLQSSQLVEFYRQMLLIRELDRKAVNYQRQGRMGTYAPVEGQEACQVGSAAVLAAADWVFPAFREQGVFLLRGIPLSSILLYFMGCEEANRVPEGNRTFPIVVPVASQLSVGVGCAMGMKLKAEKSVVAVYFSDGATSEGDFHEALNFASVYQTPTVFFCQNNQWAISVPLEKQTASRTLAQKAIAYEMPTIQIDGNDVLAVYQTAKEAVEHARSGQGPYFIEMVTYRRQMHTTADDPKKYIDPVLHQQWLDKDPISRFEIFLKGKGLIDDKLTAGVIEEAEQLMKTEYQKAQEIIKGRDPEEIFQYTYAVMPPHLQEQLAELKKSLTEKAD